MGMGTRTARDIVANSCAEPLTPQRLIVQEFEVQKTRCPGPSVYGWTARWKIPPRDYMEHAEREAVPGAKVRGAPERQTRSISRR